MGVTSRTDARVRYTHEKEACESQVKAPNDSRARPYDRHRMRPRWAEAASCELVDQKVCRLAVPYFIPKLPQVLNVII